MQRYKATGSLIHYWCNSKMQQLLWKIVWMVFWQVKYSSTMPSMRKGLTMQVWMLIPCYFPKGIRADCGPILRNMVFRLFFMLVTDGFVKCTQSNGPGLLACSTALYKHQDWWWPEFCVPWLTAKQDMPTCDQTPP